jgi:hypothetical protein
LDGGYFSFLAKVVTWQLQKLKLTMTETNNLLPSENILLFKFCTESHLFLLLFKIFFYFKFTYLNLHKTILHSTCSSPKYSVVSSFDVTLYCLELPQTPFPLCYIPSTFLCLIHSITPISYLTHAVSTICSCTTSLYAQVSLVSHLS